MRVMADTFRPIAAHVPCDILHLGPKKLVVVVCFVELENPSQLRTCVDVLLDIELCFYILLSITTATDVRS